MTSQSRARAGTDPTSWDMLESLYFEGQNLDAPARDRLLAPYRDQHSELISELEALWAHKPQSGSLFDSLPRISRSFWKGFAGEKPPEQIGPYQVIEEIGRGGMGVVYKSKQPPPLSRDVAVKVLPATLHAPSWRARFELEQKSLSAMNHANIATVHDAGVTPEGQPFLVMELLEGLPITHYCDRNRLSIKARLALFVQVCEGVNHAHRKGIIHRDLKPSNVLVIEQDGHHVPKIIDFGIAASVEITTPIPGGAALGTPAYMSPEQATHQRDKIDTRSDLYSLGALLFELLAGKPPLDAQLKEVSGTRERYQVVRDCSPKSLGQQVDMLITAEIAAARIITPDRLVRQLKGELDWIATKALAWDPEDRYDSCSALIEDLHRFLENRPISAAPERTWYPLKKWFVAHKFLVSSGLTSLVVLVVAFVITLTSLSRAMASEFRLGKVQAFSESIFSGVNPYSKGRDAKAFELLDDAAEGIGDQFAGQPELESSIRLVLARNYHDLGLYANAETHYVRACQIAMYQDPPDDESLEITGDRAYNLFLGGEREQAQVIYKKAIATAEKRYGWRHPVSLELRSGYAFVLGKLGHVERARALFETVLDRQRNLLGPTHLETFATINNFSDLLLEMQQFTEAEQLLIEALSGYQAQPGKMDLYLMSFKHNLARAYAGQKRYAEAIALGREVMAARNEILGPHHPDSLATANNLATAIGNSGASGKAIELIRKTLVGLPDIAAGSEPVLRLRHNLGHFLKQEKEFDESITVLEDTWGKWVELFGAGHLNTLITHFTLGEVLWESGRRSEGLAIFEDVVGIAEESLAPAHPMRDTFRNLWLGAKQEMDNP